VKKRTCPKIQTCPRCGEMKGLHPRGDIYACPVDDVVVAALRKFKDANGKRWKALLCEEWARGTLDEGLARAKLQIGPKRLYKIDLDRTGGRP